MKILKIVVIALCFFINYDAQAQLIIKNKSNYPLYFSYMCYDYTSQCWISEGWYSVYPNQTKVVSNRRQQGYFYYYAEQFLGGNGVWEGSDYSMLVHPTNSFKIYNADLSYQKRFGRRFYGARRFYKNSDCFTLVLN